MLLLRLAAGDQLAMGGTVGTKAVGGGAIYGSGILSRNWRCSKTYLLTMLRFGMAASGKLAMRGRYKAGGGGGDICPGVGGERGVLLLRI